MISIILNNQLFLYFINLNFFLNNIFKNKISYIFLIVILFNLTSYNFNIYFLKYFVLFLLILLIFMNNIINSSFSLLIIIKYVLPLFLNYSDFINTNQAPFFINNFIFFASTSIVIILNLNLLLSKNLSSYNFIHSFNAYFLFFFIIFTIINSIIIFIYLDFFKSIPIFWQFYKKFLFLSFIPLVMNSLKLKINKIDFLIIIFSIINILLLTYLQSFSRSTLLILVIISFLFLCRNPLQGIIVFFSTLILFPFIMILRTTDLDYSLYNLFHIIINNNTYEYVCESSNNFWRFFIYQDQIYYRLNCNSYKFISHTGFFNILSDPLIYFSGIFFTLFERLANSFELSLMILNQNYLIDNLYYNNFSAAIPSIFLEKPNFFYITGIDLFVFQLKPLTDFLSTASFGILPESISILQSSYIFVFVILFGFFILINYLINSFQSDSLKISLQVFIVSLLLFKDSFTAISLDFLFILLILLLIKFYFKYFIKFYTQ